MGNLNLPPAAWILIVIGTIFTLGWSIYSVREAGKKYGLSFFKSIPFLLIISSQAFFFFISITVRPEDTDNYNANMMWLTGTLIVCFLVALFLNIKRSTVIFGFIYTITQYISSIFAIIGVAIVVGFLNEKKERRYN